MAKKKQKSKFKKFFKENLTLIIVLLVILGLGLIAMIASLSGDQNQQSNVYGDDEIVMHYFHLTTCPHCQRMNEYIPELEAQYPNLNIKKYEMTQASSAQKYREMAQDYEGLNPDQFPGTPLTIIGDEYKVGFDTAEATGPELVEMVEQVQQSIDNNWNESMVTTIEKRRQQESQQNEE